MKSIIFLLLAFVSSVAFYNAFGDTSQGGGPSDPTAGAIGADHGLLDAASLLDDDHPQYAHLPGRAGGQTLNGGDAASENLVLSSTAHATKGEVQIPTGTSLNFTGADPFVFSNANDGGDFTVDNTSGNGIYYLFNRGPGAVAGSSTETTDTQVYFYSNATNYMFAGWEAFRTNPAFGISSGFGGGGAARDVFIERGYESEDLRITATEILLGANQTLTGVPNAVADAADATNLTINGADKTAGTGDGGEVLINGGSSVGGVGGHIRLTAADSGGGLGAEVQLTAGDSPNLNGGIVRLLGGDATGGTGPGGDLILEPGKTTGGVDGIIRPLTDATHDVGNATFRYKDYYASGDFIAGATTSYGDGTISMSDDAVADAAAGTSLVINATDKTAGTGDGGSIVLNPGTSVGGSFGRVQIPSLLANRVLVTDSVNNLMASTATSTEVGFLVGLSSNVQTQIDSKIEGAANVGSGVGIFQSIFLNDLQLRSIDAGSNKITVAQDGSSVDIDVSVANLINDIGATSSDLWSAAKIQGELDTRVAGPASATGNAIARFDLTSGKLVKNSSVVVDDSGAIMGLVLDADASGNSVTNIENDDIKSGAGIALNKLAALSSNFAVVSNGTGVLTVSPTTDTEIGYVDGVTSAIQPQINAVNDKLVGISSEQFLDGPITTGSGDQTYRTITIADDQLARMTVTCDAFGDDGSEGGSIKRTDTFRRDGAATTLLAGSTVVYSNQDCGSGANACSITMTISGTDDVLLQVNGSAGPTTIDWLCTSVINRVTL